MIKENELRIGNWYKVDATGITPESVAQFNNWQDAGNFINDCSPIILTHQILEKCGFEAYHEERSIKIGHRYFLCAEPISDGIQVFTENTNLDDECKMYHSHIKHLHQIQDLYHALTGEELEYKP